MPYNYNPREKQRALTVQFQECKEIPLPNLVHLFKELTEKIFKLFVACENRDSEVKLIIKNLINNLAVVASDKPGYRESLYLKNLLEGDKNTLKISLESSQNKLDDTAIEKYAEIFKEMVLAHLIKIRADITVASGSQGKNLYLWHMPNSRGQEKLTEEKEQSNTNLDQRARPCKKYLCKNS